MINFGTLIKHCLKRTISCVVALALILSHSANVIAQTVPDIEPPVISPEIVTSAVADVSQVFTVQASDNQTLGDVSLHFRRSGESIFQRVLMESVGDTGFFSVVVDTDPEDFRAFEYYTQALDLNGNRTVSGFAFEPFVRTLTEGSGTTVTQEPVGTPEPSTDGAVASGTAPPVQEPIPPSRPNRKWLWITLGVLAAGAVAAAASGGGGGSDGGGVTTEDDMNVPLTVIIGDPIP